MIRGGVLVASLLLGATSARGEGTTYAVDTERSRVRLELGRAGLLKILGHDHTIEAPVAAGHIEADSSDLVRAKVTLTFETRRLAVVPGTEPAKDIPEVETRMRGPEVLEVERYPEIAFTSSRVLETGATAAVPHRLRLAGTVEIKGRRTEIEVPLEVRSSPGSLVATGQVELNLRDLGIEPPSVAGVVKVANRFRVSFEIHAYVLSR